MRLTSIIVCGLFIASMSLLYSAVSFRIDAATVPALTLGAYKKPFTEGSMFFVGDVMLGRNVEILMEENGPTYPFRGSALALGDADVTVANLEGPVPEVHVPTRIFRFVFSMSESVLPVLRSSGIDVLSLANNHAFDHGIEGFAYTKEACAKAQIICVGNPSGIDETSTTVVTVGTTKVGILFLHTLVGYPTKEEIDAVMQKLSAESEMQIVYVHWGDEYVLTHAPQQETFAHLLIDSGVDAVIGHHPHVVADVALYNNKPIFYSLGNFIFDQYFSEDVMTHLGVKISLGEDTVTYTLVPFSSSSTRSSPEILEGDAADTLIARVLGQITSLAEVNFEKRTITLPR